MDHGHGSSSQIGSASATSDAGKGSTGNASQLQPQKAREGADIVFITSDNFRSKEARHAIRRRAAQYSHKVGRKPPKSKQQKTQEREDEKAAQKTAEASPSGSSTMTLPVRVIDGNTPISISTERGSSEMSSSTSPSDPDEDVELIVRDDAKKLRLSKDYVTSLTLSRSIIDREAITTTVYPVPGKPWYPQLLSYMGTWMKQGWSAMGATAEERTSTLAWVHCISQAEPAYFFMNLLSVADALQDRNLIEPQKVLWLSGQVVKAINSALSDPARMHSAGVILAVGRIALEEIVTGNREAGEKFHRPAQAKLIAMAGGLDAIGLPSMVQKHVLWADRVMTRITDTTLAELDPGVMIDSRPAEIGPQPRDVDLEVLNKYRPARRRDNSRL